MIKPMMQTEIPMSFSRRAAMIIGLKEAIVLAEINRGILEQATDFKTYNIPASVLFERKFAFLGEGEPWNTTMRLEQLGLIKVDPIDPGINITISPRVERILERILLKGEK